MDDSALRGSANDPEPPEELFRKVVDVELHMPARGTVEMTRILCTLADEMAEDDPLWASRRLRGDLARLFALMPSQMSPRVIVRFLNDLNSRRRQHGLVDEADVTAMARVLAFGHLAPALRADQHRLVRALAANDVEQLAGLWEMLTSGKRGPLPPDLSRLLRSTRHIIPQSGNWQPILARSGNPVAVPVTGPPHGAKAEARHLLSLRRLTSRLAEVLPRVMHGFGAWDWHSPRQEDDSEHLKTQEIADAAWPIIDASLASAVSPRERFRTFDYFHEIMGDHFAGDLDRVWLGDAEVLAMMHAEARNVLLSRVANGGDSRRVWLLAAPAEHLHFLDRMLIVANPEFGTRDWITVAPWLSHPGASPKVCPPGLIQPRGSIATGAVEDAGWPPFQNEGFDIGAPKVRDELA
jgi:hypothetical protein